MYVCMYVYEEKVIHVCMYVYVRFESGSRVSFTIFISYLLFIN